MDDPAGEARGDALRSARTTWGMFALSLAVLALQVALTRLLSVVLWYHFAFVAVSLAMLGLALGGIALYLVPGLLARTPALLPWACRAAAAGAVGALAYAVGNPLATVGEAELFGGAVARFYAVLAVPFLAGGLAVSALLAHRAERIHRLYLADLVGAGAGCVGVVALLSWLGAPFAVLASAAAFAVAGALFAADGPDRRAARALPDLALAAAALALGLVPAAREGLEPRHMHGRPDAVAEQGERKVFEGWNAHSRIVVVQTDERMRQINIDGSATTGSLRLSGPATPELVRREFPEAPLYGGATPYAVVGEGARVAVIGPGGGLDVLTAIHHRARLTAIELNGIIHEQMSRGVLADWSGHAYTAEGVEAVHDEARSWLSRSDERFDLIQAMMIDTWAATATGAFALAENALYTVEAFRDFRERLTERGLVHFTRWNEDPPRQSLRLLATMAEVLRREGVRDVAPYFVVLQEKAAGTGPLQASVLWSREPFEPDALARLEAHCAMRAPHNPLEVLAWPGRALDNELSRYLRSDDPEGFEAAYPWNVSPATDDKPFFFNTLRLTDVATLALDEANEQAVAVLVHVLFVVSAVVLLAFVLPFALAWRRIRRTEPPGVGLRLAYFACLGVGFMFLEMPLLQRFGLYLGHPTYALSTILTVLLLGAGAGSLLSGHLFDRRPARGVAVAAGLVIAGVAALSLLGPELLERTLTRPIGQRVAITAALLAPLAVLLGAPLPLGIRALGERGRGLVPWAWGINGAASVLASVLGVAIGMYAGFAATTLAGGACYALALALSRRLPPQN